MNTLLPTLAALACVLPATLRAQAEDQDELKARLEKKLDSEFLKRAAWLTDFDAAKAAAAELGKPIFGYFTRSFMP